MQILPILLGGVLLYLVIQFTGKMPGKALNKKFRGLGNMKGMDLDALVSKVGTYKSYRNLTDGQKVCVWQATGYMISLIIDKDNKVLKVNTETKVS